MYSQLADVGLVFTKMCFLCRRSIRVELSTCRSLTQA